MLKSQASNISPRWAIAFQVFKSLGQRRLASFSLLAVFGFTGINWLVADAIAPQPAHAYTATVNVALSRQIGESYQSFMRRAEAVARAAAQRSFDRDILVSDVAVTIVGQNDGAVVPILSLEVSRQRWRSRPDAQRWAKYFPDTQTLLRFNQTTEPQLPQDEPPPAESPVPPDGTPPRVINLPGGVRLIPNPGGGGQQNNAPNRGGAARSNTQQQNQQNNSPNGATRSNTQQQNNAPNQAAPTNAPPPAAPGRVIELPGGVRLIPNP